MNALSLSAAILLAIPQLLRADAWEKDFVSPPDETKPRCYWYWMDGVFSKEGITRDLEAMKRVGIGNAYIGIISAQGGPTKEKGLAALTDPWWDCVTHAVKEGTRLGVDIGMFNSPGWSQSGGPWVKPQQAMRHLISSETRVNGPKRFSGNLPAPQADFQDVATIAFRSPAGDTETAVAKGARVVRGEKEIIFQLESPFTVRSITVRPTAAVKTAAEYQVSDDGKTYKTIRSFSIDRHKLGVNVGPVPLAPIVVAVPATSARFHRLSFSPAVDVGEVDLSPAARIDTVAEKSLAKVFQEPLPPFDFYSWPPQAEPELPGLSIDPRKTVNLTDKVKSDGRLDWDVPPGEWVIVRTGMVPTGTRNGPAPPESTGLEVDKMNREALKTHFDAYVGELHRRLTPAERKSWKHVVADSYEMGPQNWTDGFAVKFREVYGYDPLPWLPTLGARVVGSADQSNRFLWDLRRLVADLVARDYVGGLRDLCREKGLRMWLENYGHWGFPSEFLLYGGYCDEISGEFWEAGSLGEVELRAAASAAHIYDKRQVFAEAWTGGPAFRSTPWSLKKRGDWALCEGVNQFVLHVYIHQPWEDRKPGVNAWFGTEFNRHNTWFEASKSWIDYQRRCTVMLQKGLHVADAAYFIGEDAPKMTGICQPALPPGHDFDFINADVLLRDASAHDGMLKLPHGTSYRLLVLPPIDTMRPEVLRKIGELAKAGVRVVGPRPLRSPGMKGFPDNDAEVRKLAAELWDGGIIRKVDDLKPVFESLATGPDLSGVNPKEVLFVHREDAGRQVYFLSNQTDKALDLKPIFRVAGLQPELWDPVTGGIVHTALYDHTGGSTIVPLRLEARGSMFVVFRAPSNPDRIVEVERDGKVTLSTKPTIEDQSGIATGPAGFTMACWVKPADDTTLVNETDRGISGMSESRNEVITAVHGDALVPGGGHAGCGLSVGRNGVVVFEHGAGYFAPVLVHPAKLLDWTHVAVVYQDCRPTLFLNGLKVHTGRKGPMIPAPSPSDGAFLGDLRGCQQLAHAATVDEIASWASRKPEPVSSAESVVFNAKGDVELITATAGVHRLRSAGGTLRELRVKDAPPALSLAGPWSLRFPFQKDGEPAFVLSELKSWTSLNDPRAIYHSGDAVYTMSFEMPEPAVQSGLRAVLDLGAVDSLARVSINGHAMEVLWSAPYQADVTSYVRPGKNQIEVRVWNTWHNRLLGSHLGIAGLPASAAHTTTDPKFPAKTKPLAAGLAGPVVLKFSR